MNHVVQHPARLMLKVFKVARDLLALRGDLLKHEGYEPLSGGPKRIGHFGKSTREPI